MVEPPVARLAADWLDQELAKRAKYTPYRSYEEEGEEEEGEEG